MDIPLTIVIRILILYFYGALRNPCQKMVVRCYSEQVPDKHGKNKVGIALIAAVIFHAM